MIRKISPLFLLLTLFSTMPLAAVNSETNVENEQGAVIERVLHRSGLIQQLAQLPQIVQAEMDRQPLPDATEEEAQRFKAIFVQAVAPSSMQAAVTQHLHSQYDAPKFKAMLDLLDTSLARKMTAFEVEASTATAQQAMLDFANSLSATPPSAERVKLAEKLIDVAGGLDTVLAMQLGIAEAMMRAMVPFMPPEEDVSEAKLAEVLNQIRMQMTEPMTNYLMVSVFFTYRQATDEELQQYIAMYESDTGQWMTTLFNGALVHSFKVAADVMGKDAAVEFAKRKPATAATPLKN